MKLTGLFALFISLNAIASLAPKDTFQCQERGLEGSVATLTYTRKGITWSEPSRSASSRGQANSSEEFGDVYELTDLFRDQAGGFELIVSRDLADTRVTGTVEVLFHGESQSVYDCR